MKIGYARVSTKDQNLDMQIQALTKVGCDTIYSEKVSTRKIRQELAKCLDILTSGDTLVCFKLDRLGRSVKEVVNTLDMLNTKGIQLISLMDSIDTSTAQGKLMFNVLLSFAQFERDIISERTKEGLKAAKNRGKSLGRPKSKEVARLRRMINARLKQGEKPVYIQRELQITKNQYYSAIQ